MIEDFPKLDQSATCAPFNKAYESMHEIALSGQSPSIRETRNRLLAKREHWVHLSQPHLLLSFLVAC